ncbi:MAG: dTDP-4-dehydrorhamnose 3,5-epimerase family protein [Chloroflexi bacterium]|nr:dTDP-4-dehydrorhamnose 3,5-epimerase family protein [Chloroflexota bacterium]
MIDGVVVHKLRVNRDARGLLVETLRTDWADVYDANDRPFAQTYYSITRPGVARDEDFWHCHRYQDDRFVVLLGDLVIAIADARPGSPTRGTIGLFKLGESRGDEQTELLIPRNTLHGFVVVGERPAVLVNYPTQLYNPSDELRIPFAEADVRLPDGVPFSWDLIRDREGMTR